MARILVVDDDSMVIRMIGFILKNQDMNVQVHLAGLRA